MISFWYLFAATLILEIPTIFLVFYVAGLRDRIVSLEKTIKTYNKTIPVQGKTIENLKTEFKRFTSEDAITDDMERTADLIESRMAGRQAMPRPGSEPHARIAKVPNVRKCPPPPPKRLPG